MFHTLGHMKNRIASDHSQSASQQRLDGETHIICKVADCVLAATPAEEAQLFWLYDAWRQKIKIIPPGVDLERFHPISKAKAKETIGIPAHHRNILFVGRIEPLKGIDTLLRAICLLQKRHPHIIEHVCVSIVGGDPHADTLDTEMGRLQDLRAELDIHDVVTFLGSKDQDTLKYYYAAAEMVIMPSHYESFGMVALEAMAMGTPVIASEVGGLAFLVKDGETGYHVPSRDPESLAESIYKLLWDEETRRKLGVQAMHHAQQYDWCHIVTQMGELYQQLLN
jgi:D-inositol-3-phosphate glycosyltransferase